MNANDMVTNFREQHEHFSRLDDHSYALLYGLAMSGNRTSEEFRLAQAACTDALNAYDEYVRARRRLLAAIMGRHRTKLQSARNTAA